jgi:hypothetical protein
MGFSDREGRPRGQCQKSLPEVIARSHCPSRTHTHPLENGTWSPFTANDACFDALASHILGSVLFLVSNFLQSPSRD